MNRGFGIFGIIITIAVAVVVAGGGGYGVYKYNELAEEKREIEQKLNEKLSGSTEAENTEGEEIEAQYNDDFQQTSEPNAEYIEEKSLYTPPTKVLPNSEETDVLPEEISELSIVNVLTLEKGDATYVSWETNVNSDSRILIGEDFYVSDNSNSKNHQVAFSDLANNSTINYEIVAEAGSLKVSKFGKFMTRLGELSARFGYSKDEECIVVIIEDENNAAQPDIPLEITSDWYSQSGMRFMNSKLTQMTTSWGEVEYCEKNIENIKVKNTETGKIYYNGLLPLYW